MRALSGKEFARIIEQKGWVLLRIQGSHHIYGKTGVDVRLTIPIHGNQNLKVGILRHLMKMAEITEEDLS
jgi:predicted RNA binding protein YcfA (HicA-like mRNA interferase family)